MRARSRVCAPESRPGGPATGACSPTTWSARRSVRGRRPDPEVAGQDIPYYESIPTKWDWSLDEAFAHWNGSGGKIKFVEVPRRKAKLVISYGDTGGADGVGTLGYQYRNYVTSRRRTRRPTSTTPRPACGWVGFRARARPRAGLRPHHRAVLADVPGLQLRASAKRWPLDKPGLLQLPVDRQEAAAPVHPDVRRQAEAPAEGVPDRGAPGRAAQRDVHRREHAEQAGQGRPGCHRRPSGTGRRSTSRSGRAPPAPPRRTPGSDASAWTRRPGPGRIRRSGRAPGATWCRSRTGTARPGRRRAPRSPATRPCRPRRPSARPAWRPQDGGWRFTWTPPLPGTDLVAMRNTGRPRPVRARLRRGRGRLSRAGDRDLLAPVRAAPVECLKLYVVTDWGTVSPAPRSPGRASEPRRPIPGRCLGPDSYGFLFTGPHPTASPRSAHAELDDPDTCPTTYDEDEADWLDQDFATDKWLLAGLRRRASASACSPSPLGHRQPTHPDRPRRSRRRRPPRPWGRSAPGRRPDVTRPARP